MTPAEPRLREDLRLTSPFRRGVLRTVLKDPLSGSYFDFGYIEGRILRLLDGRRTLGRVRDDLLREIRGVDLPMKTLRAFVATLRAQHLLEGGRRERDEALLKRGRRRLRGRGLGVGSLFYWKVPLGDPSRLMAALKPLGRVLFAPPFVLAAGVFVALGLVPVLADPGRFWTAARAPFVRGAPLGWAVWTLGLGLAGVFLHELGHGLACHRYGGHVPEVGLILIFGTPCAYCDVSDAWLFPRRAERIIVTLAGPYVQLLTAAAAAVVYQFSPRGSPWGTVAAAYAAASFAVAVLFNLNPLLKFDGYFLLVDLLDRGNLEQEAFDEVGRLMRRLLRGLPHRAAPAATPAGGSAALLAFAFAAVTYRVSLLVGFAVVALRLVGNGALGLSSVVGVPLLIYRGKLRLARVARTLQGRSAPATPGRSPLALRAAIAVAASLAAGALLWIDPVIARTMTLDVQSASVPVARVRATGDGVLTLRVHPADVVRAGEAVAVLQQESGSVVLRAAAAGVVGWVSDVMSVRRGEVVARIDSPSALLLRSARSGADLLLTLAATREVVLRRRSRPDEPTLARVVALSPSDEGGIRVELLAAAPGAPWLDGEHARMLVHHELRMRELLKRLIERPRRRQA